MNPMGFTSDRFCVSAFDLLEGESRARVARSRISVPDEMLGRRTTLTAAPQPISHSISSQLAVAFPHMSDVQRHQIHWVEECGPGTSRFGSMMTSWPHAPKGQSRRFPKAYSTIWSAGKPAIVAVTIFCSVASAFPCPAQTAAPALPNPGNPSITREQQQQLGFQAATEVYKQMPALPDSSPETKYIRQLGERLVATIPPQNSWPFQFHVVAQKEINAFALPGGPMFVNIGTITAAGQCKGVDLFLCDYV